MSAAECPPGVKAIGCPPLVQQSHGRPQQQHGFWSRPARLQATPQ
eukprot:gene8451-7735_t